MSKARLDPDPQRAKIVGQYLADMRRTARVSQASLAHKTGRRREYLEKIESGSVALTFEDFVVIVQALGEDPSDALDQLVHTAPWVR